MSRRSKKRDRASSSDTIRDLDNEIVRPLRVNSPVVAPRPVRPLSEIEDRRTWAPAGTPAREAGGRHARTVHKPASPLVRRGPGGKPLRSARNIWAPISYESDYFKAARSTIICIRRKARRSVLFAKKLNLKGSHSKKHRNQYSNIRCSK